MSKQALALVDLLIALHQRAIHLLIAFKNEYFEKDKMEHAIEYANTVQKLRVSGSRPFSANKLHTSHGMAERNVELSGNMKIEIDSEGKIHLTDQPNYPDQYNDYTK